ncbi:MAG: DUF362 domain-containing protein [Planctomycetota bacterium]
MSSKSCVVFAERHPAAAGKISRRDFIRTVGLGIGSLYLAPKLFMPKAFAAGNSKVVIIRNPKMTDEDGKFNEQEIKRAVYEAIKVLSDSGSTEELIDAIVTDKKNTIGLKINAYFGEATNSTKPAVANALAELLTKRNIKPNNIIIWDRAQDEMEKAGYKISLAAKEIRCMATMTHRNPRFAKPFAGYEDNPTPVAKTQVRLSKALGLCGMLINMPVLKTYKFKDNTGVAGSIMNMYQAVEIQEADMPAFYDNECNPGAADIYSLAAIKNRVKLTVCDAIYPLYNGGPGNDDRYHWRYNGIIAGLDPVAVDIVGQEIIQNYRNSVMPKETPLKSEYLNTCANTPYKLGVSDLKQINKIEREI